MKRIAAIAVMGIFFLGSAISAPLVEPRAGRTANVTAKKAKPAKAKKRGGFKAMLAKSMSFVAESAVHGGMSDR
jgi:hypothetical protein